MTTNDMDKLCKFFYYAGPEKFCEVFGGNVNDPYCLGMHLWKKYYPDFKIHHFWGGLDLSNRAKLISAINGE